MRRQVISSACVISLCAVSFVATAQVSQAAPRATTYSQTFSYTGSAQTWALPTGANGLDVNAAVVTAVGGAGASTGGTIPSTGGNGAVVIATLAIPQQATSVQVNVGGAGTGGGDGGWSTGGSGGSGCWDSDAGGGGGGATTLNIVGGASAVVVAGGGGGAGGGGSNVGGHADGGDAGTHDGAGSPGKGHAGNSGGAAGASPTSTGLSGEGGDCWDSNGGGGAGGGGVSGGGGGQEGGLENGGAGGGAGSSGVNSGVTSDVKYGTAQSAGNGSVKISWIAITSGTLPTGALQSAYYHKLQAAFTSPNLAWSQVSGTMAPGLTLAPNGILSGAPTTTGTFTPTVQATDPVSGATSTATITIPVATAPAVTGAAATGVGPTHATLGANVTADGLGVYDISCRIARTAAGVAKGKKIKATPNTLPFNASAAPVTCPATGLDQNTDYYFQVFATDKSGTGNSATTKLRTLAVPPTVQTSNAVSVRSTSATGTGIVAGHHAVTSLECQVSTSPSDFSSPAIAPATPPVIGRTGASTPMTCAISGLTSGQTYFYRVTASSVGGTTNGNVKSFVTGDAPPETTATSVTGIGYTFADVTGTVTGTGQPVNPIYCRYATSILGVPTGKVVPAIPSSASASASDVPVKCHLSGLVSGARYFVSVFADDTAGTGQSNVLQFRTVFKKPILDADAATNIRTTSATGNGTVTAYTTPVTKVQCRIATSAVGVAKGKVVPASPETVDAGVIGQSVTCPFTSLTPGTTYYYNIFGKISGSIVGPTNGPASFTTPLVRPSVTVLPTTAIGAETATGNGRVSANGSAVSAIYCMISTSPLTVPAGNKVTAVPATLAAAATNALVSCPFTSLTTHQTYYFQLFATNGGGTQSSAMTSFTTGEAPPDVSANTASNVTRTSAKGNGTVSGTGQLVTDIYCRIAKSPLAIPHGSKVTAKPKAIPGSQQDKPVGCQFEKLSGNQEYFYRVYAVDATGTATSPSVAHFKTLSSGPTVSNVAAAASSAVTASSSARVSSNGHALTALKCRAAPTPALLGKTPFVAMASPATLPANATNRVVRCGLKNLTAGQKYYFDYVATSGAGTTASSIVSFTTPGRHGPAFAPPPAIRASGPTLLLAQPSFSRSGQPISVSASATIRGDIDTFRLVRRDGKVWIVTYGRPLVVTVYWTAPTVPNGSPFRLVRTYRT